MIKLLDIALMALGGALLMVSGIVCSQLERPLTNAVKWWCFWLLFLVAIALSGCATTSSFSSRKQTQLIQEHVSVLSKEIASLKKSESRLSQKSESRLSQKSESKRTDKITLTREQWLLVRSAQLRRQAKIKLQRIELEACKKATTVQVRRERKKREHLSQKYKALLALEKRRAVLPWVLVGVASTLAVVGFSLYFGKIAP